MDVPQRLEYIWGEYTSPNVDLWSASVALLNRIQYTAFYSRILELENLGILRHDMDFYQGAIQHVLVPRLFDPGKATLSDSDKTTALLGIRISADTSIGVGYVAEAHADFGFPDLLVPIFIIGGMLGGAARYFMSRSAPFLIRQAFTTATLFLCFNFAADIDKNLGGFLSSCIVMAAALKFGYPAIGGTLVQARPAFAMADSIHPPDAPLPRELRGSS
jgi:hypothetical protein